MTRTFMTRLAVGVLAAGAVAGTVAAVPGVAFAASSAPAAGSTVTTTASATTATTAPASNPLCTPAGFAAAQQVVEAALAGRVAALDALSTAADNPANHLTAADRQTLQTSITTVELPGIQALQPQAQQATTCRALRLVARAMVVNFRVYIVMTPQTHLTVVADDETYVEGVFVNLEPTISQAIASAQAQGKDVTAAQSAFTDLKSQVAGAQSLTAGQAATVLAQTPSGAPGNWQAFLGARTNLVNARNDLHAAYRDAQQIRTDLQ